MFYFTVIMEKALCGNYAITHICMLLYIHTSFPLTVFAGGIPSIRIMPN